MLNEREEDFIVELKTVTPRIDINIRRMRSYEACQFYHQRLMQLAKDAEQKSLSLKNGNKPLATSESKVII